MIFCKTDGLFILLPLPLCSIKETGIQTLIRWFSRTLVRYLLGYPAFWVKLLFLASQLQACHVVSRLSLDSMTSIPHLSSLLSVTGNSCLKRDSRNALSHSNSMGILWKRWLPRMNSVGEQVEKKVNSVSCLVSILISVLGETHWLKLPALARYHRNHLWELFYDRRSWQGTWN